MGRLIKIVPPKLNFCVSFQDINLLFCLLPAGFCPWAQAGWRIKFCTIFSQLQNILLCCFAGLAWTVGHTAQLCPQMCCKVWPCTLYNLQGTFRRMDEESTVKLRNLSMWARIPEKYQKMSLYSTMEHIEGHIAGSGCFWLNAPETMTSLSGYPAS